MHNVLVTLEKVRGIFVLAVLLLLSLRLTAVSGQELKTVTVMGTKVIAGSQVKNPAAAREKAIANALVHAVQMTAIGILPEESLVYNLNRISELCVKHTGDVISEYKVLTEQPHGRLYRVLVKANVVVDKLQETFSKAGIVVGNKTMPNVLLLVSEEKTSDVKPIYWWGADAESEHVIVSEAQMIDVMRKAGLNIMRHGRMVQAPEDEVQTDTPTLSNQAAIHIGTRFGADIVIVGKAFSDLVPNTMGDKTQSFRGLASVRAIRVDNGEEIASTTQTRVSVDSDESAGNSAAIAAASDAAAQILTTKIVSLWQSKNEVSSSIDVVVVGERIFSNFIKFRRTLHEISGVKKIQSKELKSSQARILIDFEGNATELARLMMSKEYDGFSVDISEISAGGFQVKLISK